MAPDTVLGQVTRTGGSKVVTTPVNQEADAAAGGEAQALCRACGGPLHPWREVRSGEPSDSRHYLLLRCSSCGSATTAGDPPGPESYEQGYYTPRPPRALPLVRALQRATIGQPARVLRRAGLPTGARVLDVGAGQGRLVAALRDQGYDARGIEPSARSAAAAVNAGRPVVRVGVDEHQDAYMDAVVLWHVLEHLEDPHAALTRIHSWLRPGGLLLVGVPNLGSLQARIGGSGWYHFDVPRHRVHLSISGLHALFGQAGYVPGRVHHLVWEQNPVGMWLAILVRAGMTPSFPLHLLKRNVKPRPRDLALLAAGIPLAPVATLLEVGAAAARRGGTVVAVARA